MTNLEVLQGIFTSRAFRVPDYQRGYAWETQQRREMLEDLEDLERLDQGKIHYTGTIVLHRVKNPAVNVLGHQYTVLDIVDGQQRLTTLVILLHCLILELERIPIVEAKATADQLRRYYIRHEHLTKLNLGAISQGFFEDYVLGSQPLPAVTVPAHRNLLDCKREFIEYLGKRHQAAEDDAAWFSDLLGLVGRITTQLGFVNYEVQDEAEVGVMFEVMNARGKPLTQLEKVKNYLMYLGGKVSGEIRPLDVLTDHINTTWQHILAQMIEGGDRAEEDQFLRYHWAIYPGAEYYEEGRRDKTYDIHKAVKGTLNLRRGKETDTLYEGIEDYLQSLRAGSTAYSHLLQPESSAAFAAASSQLKEELRQRVLSLQRMGRQATVLPLLMAAYLRFEPGELAEILRLVEVFVFRLLLLGKYSNTGVTPTWDLASKVMKGECSATEAAQKLKSMIKYYGSDEETTRHLLSPDRNYYFWEGIRYFLFEYERYLRTKAGQKFDIDWNEFYRHKKQESVEHILPEGDNTLEVPYWGERFSHDQFLRNRHRLGNLTLTDWNSNYSNKPFPEKKGEPGAAPTERCYRNSQRLMERLLAGHDEWTEAQIDLRQHAMAEFAMKRWAVE